MRACQPTRDGYVERDGIKIFYEVFGAGEPTILLLPTWSLMHSRHWKMQVPYLARHCRVLTFDPRGNGRSDRPTQGKAYAEYEFAADAIAVMDATQTDSAIIVRCSLGAQCAVACRKPPAANFHVRHRLQQYGAGRMLDFKLATPDTIAAMIAHEIGRQVDYRPVERDGAARAAALIAELL
jgi:hypothetical protein